MKKLKELVKIVSKHKLKNLEIVGYGQNPTSLLSQFFRGIQENQFKTDEEAASFLYNSTPNDKNYKKLKYQLEKRIINTIFFVDANEAKFNSSQRARANCNKNYAAVQILMTRGARASGIKIAENTIKATRKYEFTSLSFEFARILFLHYSLHVPNKRKKEKYRKAVKELQTILAAEVIAESYYADIRAEFSLKKGAYSEKIAKKAKQYSDELTQKYQDIKSKKYKYFSNGLLLLSYQLNADHQNVIKFSLEAAENFKKKLSRNGAQVNYLRVIASLITIKKFKEAESYFNNEETYSNKGERNWFITQELRLILFFHTAEYQKALKILLSVFRDPNLGNMPALTQETWRLYEAYIQLFIEFKIINPELENQSIPKFKMGKFLNNIPVASKDKRGLNIQILILQVIFLLRRDKIDDALNRMQVLHQYSGKYLKKDYTYRSSVFIKMLIVLIRNQMHREAVKRKSAKYSKMLKDNPIEKSKQSIGVEVVPFEDLWEMILAETGTEFRFTPAKMKKVEAVFGPRRNTPKPNN